MTTAVCPRCGAPTPGARCPACHPLERLLAPAREAARTSGDRSPLNVAFHLLRQLPPAARWAVALVVLWLLSALLDLVPYPLLLTVLVLLLLVSRGQGQRS